MTSCHNISLVRMKNVRNIGKVANDLCRFILNFTLKMCILSVYEKREGEIYRVSEKKSRYVSS